MELLFPLVSLRLYTIMCISRYLKHSIINGLFEDFEDFVDVGMPFCFSFVWMLMLFAILGFIGMLNNTFIRTITAPSRLTAMA